MTMRPVALTVLLALAPALLLPDRAPATDWPSWRGAQQNGSTGDQVLPTDWAPQDEGRLWRAPFAGRSTPIVLNGRVYVIGRAGEGVTEQEQVACFDATDGTLLWERRFNVFHTTIPFNRVGWANLAGDPETGNVYAHGVQGLLIAFSGDGEVLWMRSLTEEFGRISGYGGRTHTPVVAGDLVIISFLNLGWGDQVIPRHRYFAFDKSNGELVWVSTPGGPPLDTTYSVPVAAEIGGRRLLVGGNADGGVYAMEVATGRTVWGFRLSQRGINSSVVVEGDLVYAAHSEENFDNTAMGRVVCIDGTGEGDVTRTHEIWRQDGLQVGYSTPALGAGVLHVVDNSANVHALDAGSGERLWELSIGTVGKGSPVWAHGKLYTTAVNGRFVILSLADKHAVITHQQTVTTAQGRGAEIYGSPAIADGNVYFATEEGLYCLGKGQQPTPSPGPAVDTAPAGKGISTAGQVPAHVQVLPAEVTLTAAAETVFRAVGFDALGRSLGTVDATWSVEGIHGVIKDRVLRMDKAAVAAGGRVTASVGSTVGSARVRVVAELPWEEDFEAIELGSRPAHWIGAGNKFKVHNLHGNRVLLKPPAPRGLHRSNVYIGTSSSSGYTVQADLMGSPSKRNRPDMGLVAQRYTLDLMGNHQRLQVRSWASDLRMAKTIDFEWQTDRWYSMKMRVDTVDGRALVKGKVWPRDEPEPKEWTIAAEDPLPNETGSPGLYGYSVGPVYYDNVKVW